MLSTTLEGAVLADSAVLGYEIALGDAVKCDSRKTARGDELGRWRRDRLGRIKRTDEYKGLPKLLRKIVDFLVRAHESPDKGIIVGQEKLARKYGVTRQTMNEYLGEIVRAGVFTVERRSRTGIGSGRGRTTNRYRLNPALLSQQKTEADIGHDIEPDNGSTYDVQVEVLTGQIEALYGEQGDATNEPIFGYALRGNPTSRAELAYQTPASSTDTTIASFDDLCATYRLVYQTAYGTPPLSIPKTTEELREGIERARERIRNPKLPVW
jgi:hypothetical protein